MKYSVVFLLLTFVMSTALASSADPFSKWTLKGWKRVALATGDLNADGIDDAAIVLDKLPPQLKSNRLSLRRMLVLLGSADGFKKILSRDNLLPSAQQDNEPCWIDPLLEADALVISDSTLMLAFRYSTSCGSYDVSNERFNFQLEGERLKLAAYELYVASRNSGEIEEIKVDLLQGTLRKTYGENLFDESQKARVRWDQLGPQQPLYLDEMTLNCDPEKLGDEPAWCE
jgi:hypothetical protein